MYPRLRRSVKGSIFRFLFVAAGHGRAQTRVATVGGRAREADLPQIEAGECAIVQPRIPTCPVGLVLAGGVAGRPYFVGQRRHLTPGPCGHHMTRAASRSR